MTLAEKLNKYNASYAVTRGKVDLQVAPEDESLYNDNGDTLVDPDAVAFLDALDKAEAFLEEHPFSRSGSNQYVCRVELGDEVAWYDDLGDCEWKPW